MTDRIGVALTATSASAALVRGDTVVWSHAVAVTREESRRDAIRQLLASSPRRRRTTVGVVVDATYVQVRPLEGLPLLDPVLLTRLVRENAPTFFLKRDGGVVTSALHRDGDAVWAAAFDRDVVEEIVAVSGELRLRLRAVAPIDETDGHWSRRAARVDGRTPLAWTPAANEMHRGHGRRLLGIALLLGMAMIALLAPLIRGALDERRSMREIAALRGVELEAAHTTAELRRVTQLLNQRIEFEERRGRMIRLVGAIARALPESTAVVSIRVDSIEVNLVAMGPHVTDLLPALTTVADPASVRVVGAVSHDMQNGAHFERAAFRFRQRRQGDAR